MRALKWFAGGAISILALGALLSSAVGAASPVADSNGATFSYVPAGGPTTLPKVAFLTAEHFTFSLLDVGGGEDGKQVLAAIEPYTTAACVEKQAAILDKMGPAFMGLSVVIEGASQPAPEVVDVQFGGVDQLTQFAIFDLVKSNHATMNIGLLRTADGWRVDPARILNAKNGKAACD